jgi:hypothetical protein
MILQVSVRALERCEANGGSMCHIWLNYKAISVIQKKVIIPRFHSPETSDSEFEVRKKSGPLTQHIRQNDVYDFSTKII